MPDLQPILPRPFQEAYASLGSNGYGTLASSVYRAGLGEPALAEIPQVLESFANLVPDAHMGDGGTYRLRAYSRYSLEPKGTGPLKISSLAGNSIFQNIEDNSLNGGVLRTYAPLAPEIADGELVRALIEHDFTHSSRCETSVRESTLAVGVHQVRIVARPGSPGLPSPEGIHRDAELFTFQHFMGRHNIEGGEFRAYDENKTMCFSWLQQDCLDTVIFRGTTWHSATPIVCADPARQGTRDIFLIDFELLGWRGGG